MECILVGLPNLCLMVYKEAQVNTTTNPFFVVHSESQSLLFEHRYIEESTKLQNLCLEKQQELQKKHLRQLKEFADTFSNNRVKDQVPSSDHDQSVERSSLSSEQSINTNISVGTASTTTINVL